MKFDRITFDPQIVGGRACIRGMRIAVGDIIDYIAGGMSIEQVLIDFPELTLDDIRAAMAYTVDQLWRQSR